MDLTLTTSSLIAILIEAALVLVGAWLIWRYGLSLAARANARKAVALTGWSLPLFPFLGIAVTVLLGGLLGQIIIAKIATFLLPGLKSGDDLWLLVAGAGFQLGMLTGAIGGYRWSIRLMPPDWAGATPPAPSPRINPWLAGPVTFLCALPLLIAINLPWTFFLEQVGWPLDKQDLLDVLTNADSPLTLVVMLALATVIAPVTEEMIFRGGLFRYLRTRVPRAWALLVPALLFGALHGNLAAFLPLVGLGIVFALAYERTGSLLVPIIAHGLFNLNTILLVIAGVPT